MNFRRNCHCWPTIRMLLVVIAMLIVRHYARAEQNAGRQLSANQQRIELQEAVELNHRSIQLQMQGTFREATVLMKQVLAIRFQLPGDAHPDVAIALNNAGIAGRAQARFEEAESCLKQALESFEKNLGRRHEYTVMRVNIVYLLCISKVKFYRAEPFAPSSGLHLHWQGFDDICRPE